MDAILSPVLSLLLLALVFSVMLRPIAPEFSGEVNRHLGNCSGKALSCGVALLFFIAAMQFLFRGCVAAIGL